MQKRKKRKHASIQHSPTTTSRLTYYAEQATAFAGVVKLITVVLTIIFRFW